MNLSFKLKSVVSSALIASAFVAASGVQAAAVVGSQALIFPGLSPSSGVSLASLTSVTLGGLMTSAAGTGDFAPFGAVMSLGVSPLLNFASLSSFTFTSGTFGTFTATSGSEQATTNPNTRDFRIDGTFSGGSAFAPNTDPISASFLVQFNQAGGGTNAISGAATLVTPALAVPLPGTLALLGLGTLALGGMARRKLV